MKRNLLVIAILIMCISSSVLLIACNKVDEDMPLQQGSRVVAIDSDNVLGVEVAAFDKYGEFKKSEYANMKLPFSQYESKKVFYTSKYFKDRDLVVAKFSAEKSASFYIKSIAYKDNVYYVDLFKVMAKNLPDTKGTFACFIELPDEANVKNVNVKISFDTKYLVDNDNENMLGSIAGVTSFQCESVRVGAGKLAARKHTSTSDLSVYMDKANDVTREVVKTFDDRFFEANDLVEIDFEKSSASTHTSLSVVGNKIIVTNFTSRHYEYSEPTTSRQVRFVPVPKGASVNEVIMVDYFEPNFGENIAPDEIKVNF